MKNIIFIPARSGSTRVPNKNLQLIGGRSLIFNKIKTCLKANVGDVIVSTDSPKIKKMAKKFGAKVPFLRPKKYASSKASTISAVLHFLRFLKKNKKKIPKFIAICPITNPFLEKKTIRDAFKKIIKNKANSLMAVTKPTDHPFVFVKLKKKIIFNLYKVNKLKWTDKERTQDWPTAYIASPSIRIAKSEYFLKYINNIYPLLNKKTCDLKSTTYIKIKKIESFDINNKSDLELARFLNKKNKIL